VSNIKQRLIEAFSREHREHLEAIRALLALPEGMDASQKQEVLRKAHTLKGASRAVGLTSIEKLAHDLESLFVARSEVPLLFEAAEATAVHAVLDGIEDWVSQWIEGRNPAEPEGAQRALAGLLGTPFEPPLAPAPVELRTVERNLSPPVSTSLAINARSLTQIMRAGTMAVDELQGNDLFVEEFKGLERGLSDLEHRLDFRVSPDEIRRDLAHLRRQARSLRTRQQGSSARMKRSLLSLQDRLQLLSLIPASAAFEGLGRMVRELAASQGKEVNFRSTGLEVEAARALLTSLREVVLHALTNAVHHGLERPERRLERGKPRAGLITLEVETETDRLRVTVSDDGQGLDTDRIVSAALAAGAIDEQSLQSLTPEQKRELVFHPGVSTSADLTAVAGRGIGMSVVFETAVRLGGEARLERSTESGQTRLIVTVPVRATAQRTLIIRSQNQRFAIPTRVIHRVERVAIEKITHEQSGSRVQVSNGAPLNLASLSALLGFPAKAETRDGKRIPVVVLRTAGAPTALAVDELLGYRDNLIHPLELGACRAPAFMGGLFLDDNSVCLVLSPTFLMRATPVTELEVEDQSAPGLPDERPLIMVVDDSLTSRTLGKGILENEGYRVRLAGDGLEALQELRNEIVALVISDVEMPGLDGFGLLEAIKTTATLKHIPVVLLTSRRLPADQERGLLLGAEAYLLKQRFDQDTLLETVRQIL
jgi:two-component system chemotaxis sensor kinase CheA